jgi:hypothetical protein
MRPWLLLRRSDPFQQTDVRQGTPASAGVLLLVDLIEAVVAANAWKSIFSFPRCHRAFKVAA